MVFALVNLVDKVAVERRVWNTYAYTAVIGIFEIMIGAVECGTSTWDNFNDENRSMVIWPIIGGLVDGCSLYLYFMLLRLTDASIVVGVMYMYPAVVCILSFFVLDEQLAVAGYLGVVVLLIGAVLLSVNGIAKVVQKCRPKARILVGLQGMKKEEEKEEKNDEKRKDQPITCWCPTPHKIANCLIRCRDCDDEPEDEALGVKMEDAKKWKNKQNQDDSFYQPKKLQKNRNNNGCCTCCENVSDDDFIDKTSESEISDIGEPRSSTDSRMSMDARPSIERPSMERALDNISKDIGSDEDTASDSFNSNVISVVVPSRTRHTPMRKKATVAAARAAAARRAALASASGTSTTEDSDSSAPISRHVNPRTHPKKKKLKKVPPPHFEDVVNEKPDEVKKPARQPPKSKRPKFQKATEESDEDDDADVDSDDEEDNDDDTTATEDDNANTTEGENKKKKKPTEPKKKKKKIPPSKRKVAPKKDVEVPTVQDDDKVGQEQSQNQSSGRTTSDKEVTSPKQLEEGNTNSKLQARKNAVRPHKKYVSRSRPSPRPFDLEDLSSTTTDDVRSSMDERTESDNAATLRTMRRKPRSELPGNASRSRAAARTSNEVRTQNQRRKKHGGDTQSGQSGSETRRLRGVSISASESDSSRSTSRGRIKARARSMSLSIVRAEEKVQEVFLGCLTPGKLFAILAIPMVLTVGGYEFLIALGAKKGMKTFQVSGVEIMVQGLTLTLGAWLTKDGRACFPHEFTWNWLFALLNAALTVCSQLLTVYSLTALPAAVSSSLCAIQPLGILFLETVTCVSSFRVSQCLAFKLPPIIFIIAGVALLSVDVLLA